uniref:regulatory protein RecX n=1 Tax=Agathobacter sp. TaxID=2021311 RepID=UPI0040565C0B
MNNGKLYRQGMAADLSYRFCENGCLPEAIYVNQMEDMGKGKWRVSFDTGVSCLLYRGELRGLHLKKGSQLPQAQYEYILYDIVAKRAKKRVLYLLENMDRTEQQIREKLKANGYPECCMDIAIEYAKRFHYLDDYRYACTYVRCHMEKYSRMQLKQKLMAKGISGQLAEQAMEEEYVSDEAAQIQALLIKKKFQGERPDTPEFRRIYRFLLRRGFRSGDVLKAMNSW